MGTDIKKDRFIDSNGSCTGVPLEKRFVSSLAASVLALIFISRLPLEHYGDDTALALGFFVSMLIVLIFMPINIAAASMLAAVGGVGLGFWDWNVVGSTFGSSPFLSILGMLIVAMGCEFTPFGKRLSYVLLKKYGKKPVRMVFVLGVVSALLSAFVSNVAVIIMLSSVCGELLSAMGQKPGESRFGKVVMLIIPVTAIVGGMVLINGSPTGNYLAIKFLENSTGGYSVSYTEWAVCGILCFAFTIVPICGIYIKCFGLKNSDVDPLPESYYEQLLEDLGPMGGSEYRWLLTVFCMVACTLMGMKSGIAALLFAVISMFPGIGTVPAERAMKKLPIHVMISSGLVPLLALLFSETGLGDCMGDWIRPLTTHAGPLGLSILSALIAGILVNVFVNANVAVSALTIGIMAPVCVQQGYNPALVMMPTLFMVSYFFVMGAHNIMLLNKGYGYWEIKDPMLPGILTVLFCGVIFPVICYVAGPLFGIAVYI